MAKFLMRRSNFHFGAYDSYRIVAEGNVNKSLISFPLGTAAAIGRWRGTQYGGIVA
jgi:hypothetical protein